MIRTRQQQNLRLRIARLIDRRDPICFDVAGEYGQIFDNVKHMKWFTYAIARAIVPSTQNPESEVNV